MTTEVNREGDHLSAAGPSRWVSRKHGLVMSHHRKSIEAIRWMRDHADSIKGWTVSKSYLIEVGYFDRRVPAQVTFEPEFRAEYSTFPTAMDKLVGWLHASWEQDRDNHPSPAGRQIVWERWNDVVALVNISSLTLLPNPMFSYRFGPLSPPEGKGHELRISVVPTPISVLDSLVEQNRGCDA